PRPEQRYAAQQRNIRYGGLDPVVDAATMGAWKSAKIRGLQLGGFMNECELAQSGRSGNAVRPPFSGRPPVGRAAASLGGNGRPLCTVNALPALSPLQVASYHS
ncbi:MAG: hypothetical protein ACRD1M_03905, partial [Terriglobales bacterium]